MFVNRYQKIYDGIEVENLEVDAIKNEKEDIIPNQKYYFLTST